MPNETLLSIDVSLSGVKAVRVMAYSPLIEEKADKIYKSIKKHLNDIDQTLSSNEKNQIQGAAQ